MALKDRLLERGMKIMQDPRVAKLAQDERVMKVAMQAFQLRGKVQEQIDQRVETAAKSLGLVTKDEVRELKRTIKKLETELKKQQAGLDAVKKNG
jgi:polyhydroxyalkanoate synthesis regulator phasin